MGREIFASLHSCLMPHRDHEAAQLLMRFHHMTALKKQLVTILNRIDNTKNKDVQRASSKHFRALEFVAALVGTSAVFQFFHMARPGIKRCPTDLAARAQPAPTLSRPLPFFFIMNFC